MKLIETGTIRKKEEAKQKDRVAGLGDGISTGVGFSIGVVLIPAAIYVATKLLRR